MNSIESNYVIGIIYSNSSFIDDDGLIIKINDYELMRVLKKYFGAASFFISDTELRVLNWHVVEDLNSCIWNLPDESIWSFIRGLWDGSDTNEILNVRYNFLGNIIKKFTKIPCTGSDTSLKFDYYNKIDFLEKLYRDKGNYYSRKKYQYFLELSGLVQFKCTKKDPLAVIPSKVRASDAGFDLTAIRLLTKKGQVYFYDTCISLVPKEGYYFKIYPRSSISKTGYMLANSVGIIDSGYTGNLIIALRKVDENVDDIVLPCRIAQLVPEKCCICSMDETSIVPTETDRSQGGFGSTGL